MKEFSYTFSIPMSLEEILRQTVSGNLSKNNSMRVKILHALNNLTPEYGVNSVEILRGKVVNTTDIVVNFSSVKKKLWFQSQIETLSTEE